MSRLPMPDPCAVVIFGASGDLTRRKLAPALHNLQADGLIPDATSIVGTSRTEYSSEEFDKSLREAVGKYSRLEPTAESWERFHKDLVYVPGDVNDDDLFRRLKARLEQVDDERGTQGNRVWYLSTLPRFFGPIAEQIAKHGLTDTGGWQRLVVEKPFGHDLESARALNALLAHCFNEDQIFRIDHYLGKETVQNVYVFRFANAIFEPIWNRRYIDHIQVTVAEDEGVGTRGQFYEQTGALRDVAQNHLLQILALVGMEPPVAWDSEAIRDEKVQLLKAVRRWSITECDQIVARGQYDGYREEEGVDSHSSTETFMAMKLVIDNWRWADVPFYVRTGKNLAAKMTEVRIHFHRVPHLLFEKTAVEELEPNSLTIRIQPDEGFSLSFGTKVPGPEVEVQTVKMNFDYETEFGSGTPEAYERLLLDAMLGDATLFMRSDEIEQAWEIMDPVLQYWGRGGTPATYKPGSWGPRSANEILDGRRRWFNAED
ncbi:MAG TPA: glucose-6-phosphate dehydrogenase [Actinomycetota bacterium]|nr:glucose-6-phosphate dehydrogenase [Actinomycetota bacterium]